MPGKRSEDVAQGPDGIASNKFTPLPSSSPMPNRSQIILERSTAATSGDSNEPATKANSNSPKMSSKDSTKSNTSDESRTLAGVFVLVLFIGLVYLYGHMSGAESMRAQLPDYEIFTEREALREKQEHLRSLYYSPNPKVLASLPEQEKRLAEELEMLDRKAVEHLRQRAMMLERKLKPPNASTDTDHARESPRGVVNAQMFCEGDARTFGGLYLETADLQPTDYFLEREEKRPSECPGCPDCSLEKADPPTRQAEMVPAKIVPQDPKQVIEVCEILMTVMHEDDSTSHAQPDPETIRPPMTETGPGPAPNAVLESLSADTDAAKDEMDQIRRTQQALKSREKELEAQAKDRKKRIQELNTPKSGGISSVASNVVLGSALGFGFMMIMSMIRD